MKYRSLLLGFILMSSTGFSQTLDDCRQLAHKNYPEIKKYGLISMSEEYNLSNASKAWIPQVVFSAQATYQSATPTYPEVFRNMMQANGLDMSGISKDQYKVAVDITQNIWDGGKSRADKALATAEAIEQRSQVDVSLYDLQSRVDNIYFGILLIDERISQSESLISVLNSNLNRMKTYLKNGVAMQADVDMLEAELLGAKQSLVQLETSRASYRKMLELYIGQPLSSKKLVRPEMKEVASRISSRPELLLFDAQLNKLNAQRMSVNSTVMPKISAFAQGFYGYPGLDMFKSMVESKWSLNAMIGVRVAWNVGALYTKRNILEKLNVAKKQIDVHRDVFLFNTSLQISHDDGEILRLKKAIIDDNRIVELRSRVRAAAESQLENGVIDITDLLRKITDETVAKQMLSTHEIELLQAIYRLKTTLNQ